jgi:predicted oxidoreductase
MEYRQLGNGVAEETVGRWFAARPREVTDRAVIATKGRTRTGDDVNDAGTSRRHLDRALITSLRRLGTDTIDLYQLHAWDPLTPAEETLSFVDSAVRAGKIRYVGLSNHTGWQLQLAVSTARANGYQVLAVVGLRLDPDAMTALDAASDSDPAPIPTGHSAQLSATGPPMAPRLSASSSGPTPTQRRGTPDGLHAAR